MSFYIKILNYFLSKVVNIVVHIAVLVNIFISFHSIFFICVELFLPVASWHLLLARVFWLEASTTFRVEVLTSTCHFFIASYLASSASIYLFVSKEMLINFAKVTDLFLTNLNHSSLVFSVFIKLVLNEVKVSEFIYVHSVVHFEVLLSSLIVVHILRPYLFQSS